MASGELVRARNNAYLTADTDPDCVDACRAGGRLTCVSELRRWGVFVLDSALLHVAFAPHAGRLPRAPRAVRRHWSRSRIPVRADASVSLTEARSDAIRCQSPRAAIATLDSAMHRGLLDEAGLADLFAALPARYAVLRALVDARCESGPETFCRLILRMLGCSFEPQAVIDGIGRVDFLVDGWLIIECDSEAHHGSWADRRRDLRRDQAAATRGYVVYRPIAEDLMWHPDEVSQAVRGLLRSRGPVPQGHMPRRTRSARRTSVSGTVLLPEERGARREMS